MDVSRVELSEGDELLERERSDVEDGERVHDPVTSDVGVGERLRVGLKDELTSFVVVGAVADISRLGDLLGVTLNVPLDVMVKGVFVPCGVLDAVSVGSPVRLTV